MTILVFFSSACAEDEARPQVLILAAASVTEPLTNLVQTYEERQPMDVDTSFGGSNSLARQIVAGAPADIFISAGAAPVDLLVSSGLVADDGIRILMGNQLAVVTSPGGPAVDSLDSLTSSDVGRLSIVDPQLGPAGWYAEQALRSSGLWETLRPKMLLSRDVRAALAYVTSGNADAAIVYSTDAATATEVTVAATVPSHLHSPVTYQAVLTTQGARSPEVAGLLEFLSSEEAFAAFSSFGFSPLQP